VLPQHDGCVVQQAAGLAACPSAAGPVPFAAFACVPIRIARVVPGRNSPSFRIEPRSGKL
jgi:hypothetical protein